MSAYTNQSDLAGGRRQVTETVLFVVAALVMTYLPASAQQQVASFLRSTVLRPFAETQEALTVVRERASRLDDIQPRLDSLVAAMTAQGGLAEENRRLRGLLGLSDKLGPVFRAATVVRAGTTGAESTFLVGLGSADGVQPNAPVISARGLVGVIRDVRQDHAVGMDWTHPDFRAGAMTADGTTYGVVETRRGRFREEDRLMLNGTAFNAQVEDGALVVTSGLGGVFPRGVPVGLVNGLAEAEGGWRKSYWLTPLAEPGSATHVLVAVGTPEGSPMDLTPAFAPDSLLSEQEIVLSEQARADSLRLFSDSLARLERRLRTLGDLTEGTRTGSDVDRASSTAGVVAPALAQPPPTAVSPSAPAPEIRVPVIRPTVPRPEAGAAIPPRGDTGRRLRDTL